ncbi:beta-N-acetylglucosaminidase domain-containing protein [Neobacillus niacini]|uniref:beta-N-acetylhexosaminidase family protein n=1 Tax=Neobacillus niacini TaxID=86668 RepID=UPI0021CAF987|nr:beta-N-acetylglucosaminidase domain-containing protein [Neobacillus niacini]MCM3763730.1 beta-N-acetylglucosaminidase domain-containing protein [Neobacillus niacini]
MGMFFLKRVLLICFTVLLCLPLALPTGISQVSAAKAENPRKLAINPVPQELKVNSDGFPLTPVVGIVAGKDTDEQAINEVVLALEAAEVKRIEWFNPGEKVNTPVTIWIGGPTENPDSASVLKRLGIEGPQALKDDGYVLASSQKGKKQIVLAGKDKTGTYYAAKTLKQIIQDRKGRDWVPEVQIRDWPEMPIRGSIEGFYGPPWTHEDRLNQLDFYGDNKLNTYIYAPKDDPYHREHWREPYPEQEVARIKELIDRAKENHVKFTFSLSPGQSICYSGEQDFELLKGKMGKMWELGVTSYAIFLDDINKTLYCEQDRSKFGVDADPIAAAHAHLLNRFTEEFIETHEGAERLITVPTDYAGNQTNSYRERFAELLDKDTVVMWTGPDVVSAHVTAEGTQQVRDIFQHDLLLWDNYPVNDFERSRLFLGPLENRAPDLTAHGMVGLTANPMNEAEASKIPLFTIADYSWNPADYHPLDSWERSIQSFGGEAAGALRTFAENSVSSTLSGKDSLTLTPLIEAFWKAYGTDDTEDAASKLLKEFEKLQKAPEQLREQLDNRKFLTETKPYLEKIELYGAAGQLAVKASVAEKLADTAAAAQYREQLKTMLQSIDAIPQKIGETALRPFLVQGIWGQHVKSRKLDGTNKTRGADQLILFTPDRGATTRTNEYGYEVTVVEGIVVKRGGNNSAIPANGYVLSIHNSNWMERNWLDVNAVLGAKVLVENGQVLITPPAEQ